MQSLRQAARSLARSAGFSAFVVVTLALGFGASALIFSVIESRSFSALAQFDSTVASVSGGSEPARVRVAIVSREFNDVLGTQPMLGRVFAALRDE